MIIVIQGRAKSSRLPGKGFFPFYDQTVFERICDIALAVPSARKVVFSTGAGRQNDPIVHLLAGKDVEISRGPEDNVLERFARVAEAEDCDYVLRMTADNYLIQPRVLEAMYQAAGDAGPDYVYIDPLSHFAGELVRRDVLLAEFAREYSDMAREHVTYDIRARDDTQTLKLPVDFCGLRHDQRITLDTFDDLIVMKRLEQGSDAFRPVDCLDAVQELTRRET